MWFLGRVMSLYQNLRGRFPHTSGGEVEEGDEDRECVILPTVHRAKGLEWNTKNKVWI